MKTLAAMSFTLFLASDVVVAGIPANAYDCSGAGVAASYSTTSLSGQALITIRIGARTFSDSGEGIEIQPTVLGNLVTIIRAVVPDLRTDSLTLLVPDVNVAEPGDSENFISWLFATRTRASIAGPELVDGPVQSNRAWLLSCTATTLTF